MSQNLVFSTGCVQEKLNCQWRTLLIEINLLTSQRRMALISSRMLSLMNLHMGNIDVAEDQKKNKKVCGWWHHDVGLFHRLIKVSLPVSKRKKLKEASSSFQSDKMPPRNMHLHILRNQSKHFTKINSLGKGNLGETLRLNAIVVQKRGLAMRQIFFFSLNSLIV